MASTPDMTSIGNRDAGDSASIIYVVDDDETLRRALSALLRSAGLHVETFASSREFLVFERPDMPSCLILDVRLADECGLAVQEAAVRAGLNVPILFMTGYGDVATTVKAMKGGALDFLTKPFDDDAMLDAVGRALARDGERRARERALHAVRQAYASLTPREREVMSHVIAGLMNKQIASNLGLQEITVKVHRAQVMRKMQVRTLPDLVRQAEALGVRPSGARE
ncbi:MAG: Response regulator protein TodT [Burkholderia lata]|uniref:Response regulator protein TodT n=1 Tax=Burkholderia lata (strain ATCC 17760 / DSM 23089 / LMG 22485 / NCIMB 9086 / R18194 / 383) TaxID=482957 RepID=A0A833PLT0_BURL3|nr:response regulator [Burkholderia lata]KAF1031200.1 MAG: Response regulator protein TodT [Burkholderia lata]